MKRFAKLFSLVAIMVVFAILLTGCGVSDIMGARKAEARAEELLAEFQKIPSPDTITDANEFVDNYEQYLNLLVSLCDLWEEYHDNETILSIKDDIFSNINAWAIKSNDYTKEIVFDADLSDRFTNCTSKSIGLLEREKSLLEKYLEEAK